MEKTRKSQGFPRPLPSYKIDVFNLQRTLSLSESSVKSVVSFLLKTYRVASRQLAIYFVSRQRIQALHGQFFGSGTATDCITCPFDPPEQKGFLGEIFVCPEVASIFARKNQLDPYEELTLYLIHGFLHLMGFKDKTSLERKQMRAEEKKCLQLLGSSILRK